MEARPVYLSRHDRIEAHFLTSFIALVIARLLAYRLDNKYSIKKLAESLNALAYSFVEKNIYVGDFAGEITVDLKEKLKLDLDHKYMTYEEIRKLIATTKRHSPPAS